MTGGVARRWAGQCQFAHSGGPYGENIDANSGTPPTAPFIVGNWVTERGHYNYINNTCSGTCGHYTQVVWAASVHLGCAMQACTQNGPFGPGAWNLVVCEYDPPGNTGGRPY